MHRLSPARARPLELLLVDDSEDDVILARAALSGAHNLHLAHVSTSGSDALDFLKRRGRFASAKRPDLVLVDVNMPGISGFELLQAIKADPDLRTLPVIVLTVSVNDDDVNRAYQCGAASYIRKPVGFEQFEVVMRQFEQYWTEVASVPTP